MVKVNYGILNSDIQAKTGVTRRFGLSGLDLGFFLLCTLPCAILLFCSSCQSISKVCMIP